MPALPFPCNDDPTARLSRAPTSCTRRVPALAFVIHGIGAAALAVALLCALPARADHEAGLQAWEAGDTEAALAEWQAAAADDDARSMRALGNRYAEGLGVLQDYVTAHMWLNLAASRGDAEAARERDELAARMTARQVIEAQERAAAWLPDATRATEATGTAAEPEDSGLQDGKTVREVQKLLAALGYEPGAADGAWGARSAGAWQAFLADAGLPASETVTPEGLEALRTEGISGSAPQPSCRDAAEGTECWQEAANLPGCHVWNVYLSEKRTVTWSGRCSGGIAQGRGIEVWTGDGWSEENKGVLTDGKKNGHWVLRSANGDVEEGPFVDGEQNGHWVLRYANGVHEGPYVDGLKNGHWVHRGANGQVDEGPHVDGLRNGHWVLRGANGQVEEGPFVDGKRNGRWVLRFADGQVDEGPFVDGKRNGRWVIRFAYGQVDEGPYVDGKMNGHWVIRSAKGTVGKGPVVDDKLHGHWVYREANGTRWACEWSRGEQIDCDYY